MVDIMNFTLFGNPITKKNSQQIIMCNGRPMIIPSKQYKQYENDCLKQIGTNHEPLECVVNVKCVYYMETKRRVDLTNLLEATDDILVRANILKDDNCNIVYSHDGSHVVLGCKDNPRVEITIDEL